MIYVLLVIMAGQIDQLTPLISKLFKVMQEVVVMVQKFQKLLQLQKHGQDVLRLPDFKLVLIKLSLRLLRFQLLNVQLLQVAHQALSQVHQVFTPQLHHSQNH